MEIRTRRDLRGINKAYVFTAAALFIIVFLDFSLWLLDHLFGEEKGVIFSQDLSTLISRISITGVLLIISVILITEGQYLINYFIKKNTLINYIKIGLNFYKDILLSILPFLLTLAIVDLVFFGISSYKDLNTRFFIKEEFETRFYKHDSLLGYAPNKNVNCKFKKYYVNKTSNDTNIIWNVNYSTDSFGLRTFLNPFAGAKSEYALFFGCSYTFGVGVNDNENFPYFYSYLNPASQVYNFAMGGYGPQNMLTRLENFNIEKIVREKKGKAFYIYLINHEARAIGDMVTYVTWGKDLPYYNYKNDTLTRLGSFSRDRPIVSPLYSLLGKSNIVKYFNINFPSKIRAQDYQLTIDIIKKSSNLYKKKFHNNNFFVVIYPTVTPAVIIKYLEENNIKFINLSKLFDPETEPYYVSEYDKHPSPKAYKEVAEAVLKYINENKL